MKKFIMLIIAITLTTTLAACNDGADSDSAKKDEETNTEQQEQAKQGVEISEDEKVKDDKIVLSINDTDIKGKQYNTIYEQTKNLMNQYGQDVSDKNMIKEQTLNTIIGKELLTQEAKKQDIKFEEYIKQETEGIKVTDEEVQSAYDKIKEQNKDVPKLKEIEEQLKQSLKQQKGNQKLQKKIDELKKDAEIKNMI
ncbi:SurA N-terminal domain-containing protein [Virgibacillus ndiopensis]|uniref:SurA N-terminal domain-containing protein n=1 Tax=Virgibacillus ndiopensis TaxID=2004408 RepID=UPI00159BD873|nr:SurA N-terminal domain-containing protein [Virgibacillus ndiopensis]